MQDSLIYIYIYIYQRQNNVGRMLKRFRKEKLCVEKETPYYLLKKKKGCVNYEMMKGYFIFINVMKDNPSVKEILVLVN